MLALLLVLRRYIEATLRGLKSGPHSFRFVCHSLKLDCLGPLRNSRLSLPSLLFAHRPTTCLKSGLALIPRACLVRLMMSHSDAATSASAAAAADVAHAYL